jgi:hypothetical protein
MSSLRTSSATKDQTPCKSLFACDTPGLCPTYSTALYMANISSVKIHQDYRTPPGTRQHHLPLAPMDLHTFQLRVRRHPRIPRESSRYWASAHPSTCIHRRRFPVRVCSILVVPLRCAIRSVEGTAVRVATSGGRRELFHGWWGSHYGGEVRRWFGLVIFFYGGFGNIWDLRGFSDKRELIDLR